MSFSLYYDARRDYPLTESEIAESNKIIEKYCDSFTLKGQAEEFCVYPGYDERSVFYGSTKLPDNSWEAFSGNENIKSVTIPESVASIGYGAFRGCANLFESDTEDVTGGFTWLSSIQSRN